MSAHLLVRFFTVAMVSQTAIVKADAPTPDPLFHIERNKNANIVQYDAQVGENGLLYSKKPVEVYWVRLASDGEVKELTWVQKKYAYGVTVKLNKDKSTARLKMAANLGRSIRIGRDGEDYRAIADIDGRPSYIDKIFIHATGSGPSTKVDYIDIFGVTMNGHKEQFERFTP